MRITERIDEIGIKREMSEYQLKIDELYNISIGNATKFVLNIFLIKRSVVHYDNL